MLKIDFSKGRSIHNLYGHNVLTQEAIKAGKDERFINHICQSLGCLGKYDHLRSRLRSQLPPYVKEI